MKKWIWATGLACMLIWTLLAWAGASIIGHLPQLAGWLEGPLSAWPQFHPWLETTVAFITPLGGVIVWGIWFAGTLLAVALTAAGAWLAGRYGIHNALRNTLRPGREPPGEKPLPG